MSLENSAWFWKKYIGVFDTCCSDVAVLCRILMVVLGSSVQVKDRGWPEQQKES